MSETPDSSPPAEPPGEELDELLHQRLLQAPVGLFETDVRGACTFVNQQLCLLAGRGAEHALGWGWLDAVHPADRDGLLAAWNEAVRSGGELEHEYRLLHPSGQTTWVMARAVVRRDAAGRALGHLGAVIDIDDRRHVEDALRQSEQRHRALVERSPDGIVAMVDNVIQYANPAAARHLGVSHPRQLLGRPSLEFVHPESVALVQRRRALELGGEVLPPAEIRIVRADGSSLPVEYFSVVTEYAGQRARQLVVRDLSETKQAAAALEASQARMRALLKAVPDIIVLLDRQGVCVDHHVPDPKDALLPWDRIQGRPLGEVLPAGAGDELQRLEAEARRTGEVQVCHLTLPDAGGDRELEVRVAAVNEDRWFAIARDVTAERDAEQQAARLAERMRETQKLESLGVLAGGIAHDFNNLLTTILGFADLGLLELHAGDALRHNFQQIAQSARAAAELTRQLLAYSGQGPRSVRPLDLRELLVEMTHLLEVSVGHGRELRYDIAVALPLVEGDAAQLRQVVLNLVQNAGESYDGAPADAGPVWLRVASRDCDAATLAGTAMHDELPAGRYVVLEVEDRGAGVDQTTRDRMFEPFFSTKFPGRGLGLAAVLGIVRSHRGTIDVTSALGAGTTVRVYLPERAGSADVTPASEAWRGAGTALVVDDEPAVRALAAALLDRMGFTVFTARDRREALALLASRAADARVALFDVALPARDADEVLRELRALRPQLALVLSSAFHDASTLLRDDPPAASFVKKPYRYDELRLALRDALGE
jgi:PAS domain S-box-containing protein